MVPSRTRILSQNPLLTYKWRKKDVLPLNFLKEGINSMRNTHLIVKNQTNPLRMKLKVVSGAQVKLFSTRKAQYLAQAWTLGVTNTSAPQPNFVSRNEQRDITALGRSLVIFSFWKYCLRLVHSVRWMFTVTCWPVLELMLCSRRSPRLFLVAIFFYFVWPSVSSIHSFNKLFYLRNRQLALI